MNIRIAALRFLASAGARSCSFESSVPGGANVLRLLAAEGLVQRAPWQGKRGTRGATGTAWITPAGRLAAFRASAHAQLKAAA